MRIILLAFMAILTGCSSGDPIANEIVSQIADDAIEEEQQRIDDVLAEQERGQQSEAYTVNVTIDASFLMGNGMRNMDLTASLDAGTAIGRSINTDTYYLSFDMRVTRQQNRINLKITMTTGRRSLYLATSIMEFGITDIYFDGSNFNIDYDEDNDGIINLHERWNNTDPFDANSY